MSNPNNCKHCDHKQHPDDGWCYMFRLEPTGPCAHHTMRTEAARAMRLNAAFILRNKYTPKGQPDV